MDKLESEIIKGYNNGETAKELAARFKTSVSKVYRIVKKHGQTRTRAEAQELALQKGRAKHPTQGKARTKDVKEKISDKVAKNWKQKPVEDKEAFITTCRKNWVDRGVEAIKDMRSKAAKGLHEASKNGSKIEKYLAERLKNEGFKVNIHRKDVGGEYEVDLYLEELRIAIEIDGPQHYLPIFGEAKLIKTQQQDEVKNGLLLKRGIHVIRLRYDSNTNSNSDFREAWDRLITTIKKVQGGQLEGLIEV
jgi:very-short-patch-repair endonuclease